MHIDLEDQFPSFAPSPEKNTHSHINKITITLPDSLVESTFDETYLQEQSQTNHISLPQEKQQPQQNIQVYCRFRPAKHPCSLKYDRTMVDDGQNKYSFDQIFPPSAPQAQVYSALADRHIQAFFRGENSTLFTYGQTGSGKTYTMFGDLHREGKSKAKGSEKNFNEGLIPRCLQDIFQRRTPDETITCSILEIYNEKLIDLFDPLKQGEAIKIKETHESTSLEGLVEVRVDTHEEVMELIRFGYRDRKIAATYNNECSSRSHTVLFVYRSVRREGQALRNKLCFIDLAGSEKVRKSGVTGQTLEETKKINLSLSCLGNVVSALTSGSEHIPYRNSKLTRILKDSLNGITRTSIITTCSSERNDSVETISTIRFAVRAKKIRNKNKLENEVRSAEEEILILRRELAETKKELQEYKRREEERERCEPEEIPEESVVCQPIRSSQFGGSVTKISLLSSTRRRD